MGKRRRMSVEGPVLGPKLQESNCDWNLVLQWQFCRILMVSIWSFSISRLGKGMTKTWPTRMVIRHDDLGPLQDSEEMGKRRRMSVEEPVLGPNLPQPEVHGIEILLVVIMFKNTFQSGFLSILYSIGSKPLQIWDKEVVDGHIKRLTDEDIQSNVLEILGSNVSTTYITCPADPAATLGIKLPFLVMIVKNMKKYFSFEVQVLDDKNVRRRFRASNFQSTTRVKPYICTMPLRLDEGWNQIQFNLLDFTRRAYGTNYVETLRVQVHANCRIRRIYFSDRLYSEEELPPEFKLYLPIQKA